MMKQIMILLTSLTISFSLMAQQDSQNTVTVRGVGQIVIDNTQATVLANVRTTSQLADEAISINSAKVQAIIDALTSVGITENDIQTSRFNFSPKYNWENGQQVFDGYVVSNSLKIKINENGIIGAVLDLIIEAGATSIYSVSFDTINTTNIKKQALMRATEDAKMKAEILAKASDSTLGRAVKITLHSDGNSLIGSASGVIPSPLPPGASVILPGSNTVSTSVTIKYLLE
jgi:uncharacterized protein YggE